MINAVWLRSFCTLVEVGHFTRTAERLHMTQSGVSQHILKLEEQLGSDLLARHGKKFSLTDAGERLYKEARIIIRDLTNLEKRIGENPADEGTVRVMSPGSVGLKLYPLLLTLQQRHPKLIIDYRFAPNASIEKAIADDETDIGFMTNIPILEDVSCKPIAKEALLLVTPATLSEPSWEAITALGFIAHPDSAHHACMLLGANFPEFQNSNFFKQQGFSNQISLILEPVSMGLGFTVLPANAIEHFNKPEQIKKHTLANPVAETLYLALRRNKIMPNRVKTVLNEALKWL